MERPTLDKFPRLAGLKRLLKKSFWMLEEDKLKHVPHGKSTS
jgi:hypothetical protein